MSKSNLWEVIFIFLFLIVSVINFYEFILTYDPSKLFLGIAFLLILIYELFSLRQNYNKIFYFLMITGIFALFLTLFYCYWYAVYELMSPFFLFQVLVVVILSVGLISIYWDGRK